MTPEKAKTSIENTMININLISIISFVLVVIVYTYWFSVWKSSIDNEIERLRSRQDHIAERHTELRLNVLSIQDKAHTTDILIAEINTKLVNIERLLLDIKNGK